MIDYRERAKSWLAQAEYDLKAARDNIRNNNFSLVCFLAEQSAQKSLKGFLIAQKEIYFHIHAIADLLKKASVLKSDFRTFIEQGKILDKYYLSTRYPDTLPEPLLPFEAYGEKEAREAVEIAEKIFDVCGKHIYYRGRIVYGRMSSIKKSAFVAYRTIPRMRLRYATNESLSERRKLFFTGIKK